MNKAFHRLLNKVNFQKLFINVDYCKCADPKTEHAVFPTI